MTAPPPTMSKKRMRPRTIRVLDSPLTPLVEGPRTFGPVGLVPLQLVEAVALVLFGLRVLRVHNTPGLGCSHTPLYYTLLCCATHDYTLVCSTTHYDTRLCYATYYYTPLCCITHYDTLRHTTTHHCTLLHTGVADSRLAC